MHLSTFFSVALAAASSTSAPLRKRVSTPEVDDGTILNYSLTLEYLQRAFYRDGLNSFKRRDFLEAGFEDPFYGNVQQIYQDQQDQVTLLIHALQGTGIRRTEELSYNFPYFDVASWVSLAGILGSIGTSAYLGAAASVADKDYLTASNSILGSEARHASYMRATLSESPFPNAFETPLSFNEVYTLASRFITNNSSPPTLPFEAFPDLNIQCSPYHYEEGRSSITFSGAFEEAVKLGVKQMTPIFAIFSSGLMRVASSIVPHVPRCVALTNNQIPVQARLTGGRKDYKIDKIPDGVLGQSYVVLSTSKSEVRDEDIVAGPAILEVYPKGKVPLTPKFCD